MEAPARRHTEIQPLSESSGLLCYYGVMATRKMTFSLPTALATQFIKRVSARERSGYDAEALAARLRERDRLLARAAEVANRSRHVRAIEQEFEKLEGEPAEPWKVLNGYRLVHNL